MTAALIDLDGVLYEADRPIAGAGETLEFLQEQKVARLFLTNTTSRPRAALVDKLAAMEIQVACHEILTPPVAAARWLAQNVRGPVALFAPAAIANEFDAVTLAGTRGDDPVAAVVIGDYGERWSFAEMNRAFRLLINEPRPALVALGMTRYWHSPDGLRLDTAPFVVALQHATGVEPVVLGKPAAPFFEAALAMLGASAGQTIMIGDDIRTDIDAAQRLGMRGVLVKTGKFRSGDLDLGIRPAVVLDSIADLPDWWRERLVDE